jgi:NADP-dependent 3-hydroxy acid dehydrogenase YdfG
LKENLVTSSILALLLQSLSSNGNVYCASKHAVDALNQGMRIDLNPFGIRDHSSSMVETEFSEFASKGIPIEPKMYKVHPFEILLILFILWYHDRTTSTLQI